MPLRVAFVKATKNSQKITQFQYGKETNVTIEHTLVYGSHVLNITQTNYSSMEGELFRIFCSSKPSLSLIFNIFCFYKR